MAVGIGSREDASASPESKHAKIDAVYPWGGDFPPSRGAGNYAGSEAKTATWPSGYKTITGYTDDFARTAPVMNFSANKLGLYDLGGNVWEWCGDWYNAKQEYRVLRGGSWFFGDSSFLLSSYRGYDLPTGRSVNYGFRLVLVSGG
jgi:formylglycine-generating enzyme required for sulfatase activity